MTAAVAVVAGARPAQGMSCADMEDHYALICDASDCRPLFRASDVGAYGRCGREMTLSRFPEWALEPIVALVRSSVPRSSRPLVTTVALSHSYANVPASATELRESLARRPDARVSQHAEGVDEVMKWYGQRRAADASQVRLQIVRDLLLAASVLVALMGTLLWLATSLHRRDWSASTKLLGIALVIRLALFLIGLGSVVLMVFPLPMLLLAPLSLLFALLDVVVYLPARWLRRCERWRVSRNSDT